MTSGLAVEFEDVFWGQPGELETRARRLEATAEAIQRAADALLDLVDDQRSEATDELAVAAEEASAGLRRARRRYAGTGAALTTYAVELAPLQSRARDAVDDADFHQARVYRLQNEVHDLEGDVLRADAVGDSTTALESDLWDARNGVSYSTQQVSAARTTLYDVRRLIGEAADRAISAIETATEHGADSFGDDWNQFWEGVGDFFEMLGEWASQVLAVVVDALMEALSALVSALVVIALLLVAALLIGLVFTAFGLVGLLLLGGLLAAFLLTIGISETLNGPRRGPTETTSTAPTGSDADAANDALEARDYQGLMDDLALQDANGGESATEIRVVAIRDADGNIVSWRIQLPSTQNWNVTNSDGALNDARADVMLSMFPGVPTQYEQAVWDAMTQAGVFESDAPIMFTGWSLGGMMAGELATDPRVSDRVQSVFTAGSAIDKHYSAMPPGVRVTQINNGIDPVHTLEFVGLDPIDSFRALDPDWQTYRPLTWPMHDAGMYGAEAERYLPEPRPGDEIFFAEEGPGSYEEVFVAQYTRGS